MQNMKEIWTDPLNNVWIWANPQRTIFQVWHRHNGGCSPRLFPESAAPDKVLCITQQSAIRAAAQMVRAYRNR